MPALADFIAGYEATGWYGIIAPKNTPTSIVKKLNAEINAAIAEIELKNRLSQLGATAFASSPGEFGAFISSEIHKWGKVIRSANIELQ